MGVKGRVVEEHFSSTDLMTMTAGLLTPLPWPDWSARVRSLEVDGTRADYIEIDPYRHEVAPGRDRPEGPVRMMLTIIVSGTSIGDVDGHHLVLNSKQAALIDGRASIRFHAPEPVRAFRIFVDEDHLPAEQLNCRTLPFVRLKHSPLVAACAGFVSGLLQVGNPIVGPQDEVAVSQPLIALQTSLLNEALHAVDEAPGAGDVLSRGAQINAFIDEHLAERDLSVATIAAAIGVTPRTVHAAYNGSDVTVAADIRDRRLVRAKALLVGREETPNVTALAARVGLSSDRLARAFQAGTGSTVRQWWEAHREHR